MNKVDFLRRLDRGLAVLDKEERKELLGFYEERFHTSKVYENKTDEEIIAELGSPESIARNILQEYGVSKKFVKTKEERYQGVDGGNLVVLILFDVFIATWLIPTLISVAFALLGSTVSYVGAFTLIIGEHSLNDTYFFWFLTGVYFLLFMFALVVFDLALWVVKKVFIWHLNVFKIKGRENWIKRLSKVSVDAFFKKRRFLNTLKNFALIGSIAVIGITGFRLMISEPNYFEEITNQPVQTDTYSAEVADDIAAGNEWTIATDFENMQIELSESTDDTLSVVHSYTELHQFTIELDEETRTIIMSNDYPDFSGFNFRDFVSLFGSKDQVIITIPQGLVLGEINLQTLNGEIRVDDMELENLNASTMNGVIRLEDVTVEEDVDLQTSNGVILLIDVFAPGQRLDASTSNGTIELDNVVFESYYLDTSNGKIKLNDLNVENQDGITLVADTSNGSIDVKNVYVSNVELDTSNGSIEYYNDDLTFDVDLDWDTTNGSKEGNVK